MNKQFVKLAAVAGLLMVPAASIAQDFDGGGDGVNFEDPLNWVGDVLPTGNTDIVGGFSVDLSSNQSINELDVVGDQSIGTAVLNQSSGTLSTGGWTKVGGNTGGTTNDGTYNLSGTAAVAGSTNAFVGFGGGVGTVNLSDSASFTTGEFRLAANGAGSTGTLSVTDNASFTADNFNSGGDVGSVATVNQTGGTVTSNNWISLSNFSPGGTATYDISGGTVAANNGNFAIGQEGAGTLNVSGTAVVSQTHTGADAILVGGIAGGLNQVGTGVLNIDGSAASINGEDLRVGLTAGSVGTINFTADAGGVTEIVSADNTEFGPGDSFLTVDLTALSSFSTFGSGSPLEILLIDNANAVSGTFNGLAEGAAIDIGDGFASGATISYFGGDGNDVVINVLASAIPEPSSITVLGLACFGLMGRRRRQV